MYHWRNRKAGFTLVEIIVVLVILAILAALLIPAMTGWIDKAKKKQAYVELRTCAVAARSAYAEIYALHPGTAKSDQFIYAKGSTDAEFAKLFDAYLENEDILANVQTVWISGEFLGISYTKDGVTYAYRDVGGTITITEM